MHIETFLAHTENTEESKMLSKAPVSINHCLGIASLIVGTELFIYSLECPCKA